MSKSANQLYKEYVKQCRDDGKEYLTWKEWINEQKKNQFSIYGQPPVNEKLSDDVKKTLDGLKGVISSQEKNVNILAFAAILATIGFVFYKKSKA